MPTDTEELLIFAHMYYKENKDIRDIAAEVNCAESKVRRRIKEARDRGMVEVLIISPTNYNHLLDLQAKVKFTYDLKDVIVTPGREDVMEVESNPAKEAV